MKTKEELSTHLIGAFVEARSAGIAAEDITTEFLRVGFTASVLIERTDLILAEFEKMLGMLREINSRRRAFSVLRNELAKDDAARTVE